MSAHKLGSVYTFLMSGKNLELLPHESLTLAKNSVFLIEVLLPKKKDKLNFLDKGTRHSPQPQCHSFRTVNTLEKRH